MVDQGLVEDREPVRRQRGQVKAAQLGPERAGKARGVSVYFGARWVAKKPRRFVGP